MVDRKKKTIFGYLRECIWKKINSWSVKCLSKAGREVLVKAVAQAIPTYAMSVYLLPSTLSVELECMMNSFWWGSRKGAIKGINWLTWKHMTTRKESGGLGFRYLACRF